MWGGCAGGHDNCCYPHLREHVAISEAFTHSCEGKTCASAVNECCLLSWLALREAISTHSEGP